MCVSIGALLPDPGDLVPPAAPWHEEQCDRWVLNCKHEEKQKEGQPSELS